MTVSLNNIVKITPSVLSVGNNSNNLYGLLITQNGILPASQITSFSNAAQVDILFDGNSTEYELANIYFNGFVDSDRTPDLLYMAPYFPESSFASLQGGNISAFSRDIASLKNLPGAMSISIDGIAQNIDGVNFSTANSLEDAASILQKALTVLQLNIHHSQKG